MITMAYFKKQGVVTYVPAALGPPDSVCYDRVALMSQPSGGASATRSPDEVPSGGMFDGRVGQKPDVILNRGALVGGTLGDPMSAHRSVGPNEFAKHLRETCGDDLVLQELSLMLKQHNAKCTLSMTLLRNRMQSDMFSFADSYRACAGPFPFFSKRGLSKCVMLDDPGRRCAGGKLMHLRNVTMVARLLVMSNDEDRG
ncbi:hypothetical protein VPH35_003873 [Triticum aestivum]|uniref:uncharacterized protein isoform X2 n=1 Tax=Triticum aestivum TaxID=4565 RepID=UPI001D024AFF|nr:uncharacterized protein LOC123168311 isoform X2 [Triticum aestivum]